MDARQSKNRGETTTSARPTDTPLGSNATETSDQTGRSGRTDRAMQAGSAVVLPPGAREVARGISTLAVHAGEPRPKFGNALATPILQTATYTFADTRELQDHFERRIEREEYGRYGNPTQRIA